MTRDDLPDCCWHCTRCGTRCCDSLPSPGEVQRLCVGCWEREGDEGGDAEERFWDGQFGDVA